jgi:hypothetical protein
MIVLFLVACPLTVFFRFIENSICILLLVKHSDSVSYMTESGTTPKTIVLAEL